MHNALVLLGGLDMIITRKVKEKLDRIQNLEDTTIQGLEKEHSKQ